MKRSPKRSCARIQGYSVKLLPANNSAGTMARDFTLALVDDEPDVSHVGLNQVRFYAERNLALPLDRYIAHGATPLTAHQTIGRIAGETRALPFAVSVPVNYFNDDLLRSARVTIRRRLPRAAGPRC